MAVARFRSDQAALVFEKARLKRGQCTRREMAVDLLRSWFFGNEAEQRETLESLVSGLDENRPVGSKLFEKE